MKAEKTKTQIAIEMYKELGSFTGGLQPEFQADLDALENGQGFTEHAEQVFEALTKTLMYRDRVKQENFTIRLYPDEIEKLKQHKNKSGLAWPQFIKLLIKEHEEIEEK